MRKLVRFDWALKNLLRRKANFDILEGFLSELLEDPTLKIECILESEQVQQKGDYLPCLDVLASTQNRTYVIIKIQCYCQADFLSRILYSTAKTICAYPQTTSTYCRLSKVISINIVFFDSGVGRDYLYKGSTNFIGLQGGEDLVLHELEEGAYQVMRHKKDIYRKNPQDIYPEYYIIKISHFKGKIKNKFDEWIYFLKKGKIQETFSARGLDSASTKLALLQLSSTDRKAYGDYERTLKERDSCSRLEKTAALAASFQKQSCRIGISEGEIGSPP